MNTKTTGIEKWHELDGDNTLALDWPLDENSHVWEIGGFEGRWVQQIWDKFHCHITVFEPQDWAVGKLNDRFQGNDKIDIRPYGLWNDDEMKNLGNYETDGASLFSEKEPVKRVEFKNFYPEILNFTPAIDLALMNIEGAEYTLIPEFIGTGVISRFGNFWCQFHPKEIDQIDIQAEYIFRRMEETHTVLWNCFPTAVAWTLRLL